MKNIHLQHPEDTILTGDLTVLDALLEESHFSVKIDGAPAIVWGINPATGSWFCGTKSVFNKKKIKINESHEDIDRNHEGDVADILHACFDALPRDEGIFQGDFIGFGGEYEYTPNTITYQFFDRVDAEIIVAPHTFYHAKNDLRDAVAYPLLMRMESKSYCKFIQPRAWVSGGYGSSIEDKFYDLFALKQSINFAKTISGSVEWATAKEAKEITKQINACIRNNEEVDPQDFDCDSLLIEFWKLVESIKLDALRELRNAAKFGAYLGYDQIDCEGYVLTNDYGSFKLVNRRVFSHANFTQGRFQTT